MRKFNLRPDVTDQRDKLFKDYSRATYKLPEFIDLRGQMSEVEDQGQLGSCTANAFAGNLEYLWRMKNDPFEASRLFIYYYERQYINSVSEDSGANLRDGIKALKQVGVCSEKTWPYDLLKFTEAPSLEAINEALDRRISHYLRIEDQDEMKKCLSDGYPFVFGIPIYESFESPETAISGRIRMPGRDETMLGGHALLCVGYLEESRQYIIRNSWGAGWGDKGYCYLPYEYMDQADDVWTVRG